MGSVLSNFFHSNNIGHLFNSHPSHVSETTREIILSLLEEIDNFEDGQFNWHVIETTFLAYIPKV